MNLEALFQEYMNVDFADDRITKLEELFKLAKSENNQAVYQKTALEIANHLETQGELESAQEILSIALASEIISDRQLTLEITDKLISLLLRIEDFLELKKLLEYRLQFVESDRQALLMQKFYLAVTYEGLGENDLAIATLLDIEDTLSKSNEVSKYLKLSMLYLRENKVLEAKRYYEYAARFDPDRRNPIFDLVYSDILAYEENYTEALTKFQDYFLKSKAKTKYLDRYILLMLKLKNYGEATKYYREYLPVVDKLTSKHSRKMFYEAGLKLALELKDFNELAVIREKINSLSHPVTVDIDPYAGLLELIKQSDTPRSFSSKRDVLLDVVRAVAKVMPSDRLFFVHLADNGFTVLTHNKGLLLEKTYAVDQSKGTIIDLIMSQNEAEFVSSGEELSKAIDHATRAPLKDSEYLVAVKTSQDLYPKGYIAALLPNQAPFQKCRRIMVAAATLVTQKMSAFKLVDQTRSDLGTLKWAAGSYQFGVFEIENGKIWFKNEIAKDLFGFKEDVTTFESLQKRIKSDPKLYLDDFFRKPSLTFSYEFENSQFRDYHVKLEAVGLKVRGIIEDHTKRDHLEISQDILINKTDIYGNKLFVLFEKEYLSIQTNHSYLLMTFKMATEPFASCSLTQFQTFGKELIQDAKTSAKGYLFAIYSLSPNVFVIVLKTTDKRIIDRISNDLHKAAISSKALAYPPALRFASLSPLKKMPFSSIMEALTQLANYDYLPIEGVYYSRNEQLRESELQHSAGVALRRVLQDKAVVIEYHPLVDWQSGLAHMYEVKFSLSQTFASHKILFQAAQKANLIRELHQETIKSLGRDLKKMAIKASADIVYLYRLSRNDLSDMAICSFINSELKKQRISGKKICLLLEYDEANPKVTISRANYFHSEGFGVALSHFVTKIRISDFEDLRQFCLGYVTKREIEMVPGFWLDLVNGYFQEGFVYHHESDTIRKSELESAKCKYVVGRAYPAYQAIDDLIAKIQGKQ